MRFFNFILPGWWYTYPSEKYEFVSWDYSQLNGKIKFMFQTTNQYFMIQSSAGLLASLLLMVKSCLFPLFDNLTPQSCCILH